MLYLGGYNPYDHAYGIATNLGFDSIEDLRSYDGILDVGAGNCVLAKVAEAHDIAIQSIDNGSDMGIVIACPMPDYSSSVPFDLADALDMPYEDEQFDLVVSQAGPLVCLETEEQVRACLTQMMRVARREIRICPTSIDGVYRAPEQRFQALPESELAPIREKSHNLLRRVFPQIELHSSNDEDHAIIRK